MNLTNNNIRKLIEDSNLKYWQVAKEYGLSDGNFSRLLRFELSKEKKEKIIKIIEKLKKEEE